MKTSLTQISTNLCLVRAPHHCAITTFSPQRNCQISALVFFFFFCACAPDLLHQVGILDSKSNHLPITSKLSRDIVPIDCEMSHLKFLYMNKPQMIKDSIDNLEQISVKTVERCSYMYEIQSNMTNDGRACNVGQLTEIVRFGMTDKDV